MSRSLSTARFAAILAVAAIVFTAGMVSGAAGDPLILGSQANNSGASGTKVTSSVVGNAFAVTQIAAGAAANGIRGDATDGSGGLFTSQTNNALFATAASGNRFAIAAVSNGGAGTGGALFADGNANPALDLQTNAGVAPMTVNSSTLVSSLNSDLVDGFQASSISRTAFTVTENAAGDGAGGTILSTTITAPTRGWYSIVASVDSYSFGASDDFNCQLNLNGDYVGGSLRYVALVDNANEEQDCSTSAGVSTCGGAQTITLTASGVGVGTSFDAGSLQVIFTPFSGTGTQPSLLGCLVIIPLPEMKDGVDLAD